jgi:ubiquilin
MAPISLTIRLANSKRHTLSVDEGASVNELKEAIAASELQIPASEQRLIFKGKVLKDDTLLNTYGQCPREGSEST